MDNVSFVAADDVNTYAIKTDGSLWRWNDTSDIVKLMDNVSIVTCGKCYNLAIKADGSLWGWGDNDDCLLGNDIGYEKLIKLMDNVTSVAAGDDFSLAIKEDGKLCTWGLNDRGQLGNGIIWSELPIPFNIQPESVYSILGYVYTDSTVKEGFKVEVVGTNFSTISNSDGSFKISNVPVNQSSYAIRISKAGYLCRNIENIKIEKSDIMIGSINSPVELWAGDINMDNSINMADILEIAKYFNTNSDNENFKNELDFNKDNSINIIDIILIAKHFNETTYNYLQII